MQGTNSYKKANLLLDNFIAKNLKLYDRLRNYDYGLDDPHKYVSGLSPYISIGLIDESYILKTIAKQKVNNNKFIDEVLWRTYWKGWLEKRSKVWHSYRGDLGAIKSKKIYLKEKLNRALKGETNIDPFNKWIEQLVKTGYLHNHARMWFASIWIHYLNLPWQLGANFFLENLLDADPAVNTLSWRWVAGIQTLGKTYIATEENINKYTFNKFFGFKLPLKKNISIEEKKPQINDIYFNQKFTLDEKSTVLIFSNNINPRFILSKIKKIKRLILITFDKISLEKSIFSSKFAKQIIAEGIDFYNNKYENFFVINLPTEYKKFENIIISNKISELHYEYITSGYEKDLFEGCLSKLQINIKKNILLDEFYIDSWRFCSKGFFNFKKNIPSLLEKHIKV